MSCGKPLKTNQGICRGDSGGPAVINGVLVGIPSRGTDTCGDGADDVCTSVAHYRPFLTGAV
ncbi:trypsin-like serine protease [Streptomyces sp. AV19]|nr:trypsin-like serine protease [Streptomyces sp. AV19]